MSALAFSHRTLIHCSQLLLFLQQISFLLLAFAEGYNHEISSGAFSACLDLVVIKISGKHRRLQFLVVFVFH
jgi:hypothetical protein